MVGITALDQQQESVQAQYLAPLIANGANGQLAVRPVDTEINIGKLKCKPAMEDNHVMEMQAGETVMSDRV